ncbi:MAG: AAA family ATPase [Armatimonadetes bacterium]|nr:AAA family ATPase [Armatimonadota bacterium]
MGKTIAVTGKGGTGKTAVASMVVRVLLDAGARPLLAVDGDPNSNFGGALGVRAELSVGSIRESEIEDRGLLPAGMSKPEYFEYRIWQALVETDGFDFIEMGRPEGPGCYCFANSMLRTALDKLAGRYQWIVVDCEAGLEHFSRRTAGDIDLLVLLADPSYRGLETARKVLDLAASLGTRIGESVVAVNRCPDPMPAQLVAAAARLGITISACLPEDAEIKRRDLSGEPLISIPGNSPLLAGVRAFLASTRTVGPVLAGSGVLEE